MIKVWVVPVCTVSDVKNIADGRYIYLLKNIPPSSSPLPDSVRSFGDKKIKRGERRQNLKKK